MEKLTLVPKTDSITICLPPDWVDKVIVCTLQNVSEEAVTRHAMAAEKKSPIQSLKKEEDREKNQCKLAPIRCMNS